MHRAYDKEDIRTDISEWLTGVLDSAVTAGEVPVGSNTRERAYFLLSLMEGSSFIDWAMQDGRRLDTAALSQLARMPPPVR